MQDDDDDLDDAFSAFERGRSRVRPVLEVERERIARGYRADYALQAHGRALEQEMLRVLEYEAETLRSTQHSADILSFPAVKKAGDA